MHLTGGILRHFRAFSTPEQNPALEVLSTPAHPQVTLAVGRREENTDGSLKGKVELLQHPAHHAPLDEYEMYSKLSGRRVVCCVAQPGFFWLVCTCGAQRSAVYRVHRQEKGCALVR